VIEPLKRAIQNFQAQPEYRMRCFEMLGVQDPVRVIDGLDLLAADLGFPPTERTFTEGQNGEEFALWQTPQQLWERYSQGIPTPIEGKQFTAIARRALQDNTETRVIQQMLLEAPYLKGLQERQGLERAQEFARLAIRNAEVQIQQSQQTPQKGRDREVER